MPSDSLPATETVFRAEPYARDCAATVLAATDDGAVILDRTVFYPTGGGQPGDSGRLIAEDGRVWVVTEAVKGPAPDTIAHRLAADGAEAPPPPGLRLTAALDWDRRHAHMRLHTCLHLLSAIITAPVTGGQVGAGRARLDFDWPEAGLDKQAITDALNALITADHPVTADWISDAELDAAPQLVKTMSVQPPRGAGRVRLIRIGNGDGGVDGDIDGDQAAPAHVDLQPCGGTHVARTGEIGPVEVMKIEKKGRQNRRVVVAFAG